MAVTKKKNPKNYSARDIVEWKFEHIPLEQKWLDHLGEIPEGAKILVKGPAKNGKTDYMVQMACAFMDVGCKTNYNSPEQGKSKSFQEAAIRHGITKFIGEGKFVYCEKSQRAFPNWFRRLTAPNSGNVCILDSADYMGITFEQMKLLFERFPKKTFIIVCWLVNPHIKKFEHLMDAIVEVKNFVAKPISRYGGNKDFVIWDKAVKKNGQTSMF